MSMTNTEAKHLNGEDLEAHMEEHTSKVLLRTHTRLPVEKIRLKEWILEGFPTRLKFLNSFLVSSHHSLVVEDNRGETYTNSSLLLKKQSTEQKKKLS